MYVSSLSYPIHSPVHLGGGHVPMSSLSPPVSNLYWHYRIAIAASDWKRGGTDAWPNDEPTFHIPGMVGLFFLVTFACKLVRQNCIVSLVDYTNSIHYVAVDYKLPLYTFFERPRPPHNLPRLSQPGNRSATSRPTVWRASRAL